MKTILTLLAVLIAMPLMAQHTISGTVTDQETHETLVGATIYLPDLFKGTTSDLQGHYGLQSVPTGSFTIEFSFVGYKPLFLHLHIANDTTLNVALVPDLKEMKEIIVTGVSQATEIKLSPVPAVIATRTSLFTEPSTNLIDGLSSIPGIEQLSTGPAISKPIIRGLGSNRVLTLYNGLRQEGQQWGDEHGIEIDEFSVDKVEIIKGPGSIAYGSDAMAGVINFITPHAVEEGKITGTVDAGYQTNNNQYHISGATSGNINGFNWRARVTRKQAGNYQNQYDGKVFNSGFDEINWSAQAGINKSWGYSHLYTSYFKQHLGLIEGERDINGNFIKQTLDASGQPVEETVTADDLNGYQIFIPRQQIRHFRLGSSNMFFFNKGSMMLKLDYQVNKREEFADVANPDDQELFFKLNTFNYSIKYFLPEKKHWQTSIGLNGMQQTNYNLGEEALIPEYSLFDGGIYVLTQKQFDKVMISGGLRYDNRAINSRQLIIDENGSSYEKFAPFTRNFSHVSGSAGFSYQPVETWNFKLNIARGFRAPTLAELSSNGVHEGSFRYEYGNLELDPETSLQADLGVDLDTKHMTIEVSAFINHIDNYIYLHKLRDSQGNDSIPDPANGAIAFKYVQNAANLWGGEAAIDIHPHPFHWLHFENSISFVYAAQADQPDSMKYLPFIPATKFKSELRANINTKKTFLSGSFIKIEWAYYFAQERIFEAYDTETITPAYNLLNAAAGTTFMNKSKRPVFKVVLMANNILDEAYQNHLSRLKYAPENPATGRSGVFNMGRNFAIKMLIPIRFK